MVKPSSLQAFAHRPALVRSKCGFENRIKNTFFIRSVSAYRELLIAAVLVVTIVQHRTSVLDKTACVCSKTSRVKHTKSVHNRPKPAVFVRTALGLSSNQNEVAIYSKSGLWRTALLAERQLQAVVKITSYTHKILLTSYIFSTASNKTSIQSIIDWFRASLNTDQETQTDYQHKPGLATLRYSLTCWIQVK